MADELYFCIHPNSKYIENSRNNLKNGIVGIVTIAFGLWNNWF